MAATTAITAYGEDGDDSLTGGSAADGTLAVTATVGFAMLWWPVLNAIAALGFMILGIAAFGLGLGDTWADWRNRTKTTNPS